MKSKGFMRRRLRVGAAVLAAAAILAAAFGWQRHRAAARLLETLPDLALDSLEQPLALRLESLRDWVRDHPRDPAGWGRLGMVLHIHQFHRPAAACYAVASKLDPRAFAWAYFRGQTLQALEDTAAHEALLRADALEPQYPPLQFRLGQLAITQGRFADARKRLRDAADEPGGYPARIALAQAYAAEDSLAMADSLARAAQEAFPRFREARALLADLRRQQGGGGAPKPGKAEDLASFPVFGDYPDPYVDSLVAQGVTFFWRRNRGDRLARRGQWPDAAAEYREALRIRPDAEVFAQLAEVLARMGNGVEAERELNRALVVFPDDAALLNAMGFLFAMRMQAEEAVPWYRKAIAARPEDPAGYRNLATALAAAGRLQDAGRNCREALARFPQDGPLLEHCAVIDSAARGKKP